uniref:Uncharacterized protein MANES_10G075600 n=1 Tax=Rhizophora mucronata TaxID=61149 RepID=A0A2P2LBN5_RHIMU
MCVEAGPSYEATYRCVLVAFVIEMSLCRHYSFHLGHLKQ